jgi:hypothetical protein
MVWFSGEMRAEEDEDENEEVPWRIGLFIYFDLGLFLDLLPCSRQAERESVCDRRCHV